METMLYLLLVCVLGGLLLGFPVAFVLSGVSILFALLGDAMGVFDLSYLNAIPTRIYGIMQNELLLAVPLFVFMGVTLERAKIAENLLSTMAALFGKLRGGLGFSVLIVGALLAASTGIVGATVVTMGLISLPTMLRAGYCPRLTCGAICAAGTLGQIIPPSIVLILLGDQIAGSWQSAQMKLGITATEPLTIADLFVGALVPGLGLVALYLMWVVYHTIMRPERVPPLPQVERAALLEGGALKQATQVLLPPLLLIGVVLGSILFGLATATESAAIGAMGALALAAWQRELSKENLRMIVDSTARVTCMVFTILIGATIFTLVFRGFGGEQVIHGFLSNLPGGLWGALFFTMLVMFVLGFFLDFIEIIFVVVPIVSPILLMMGANPLWLAILMAVNLQTSFLTPPFGFALFYLRGVAPATISTLQIYRGVIPFVVMQLVMVASVAYWPGLATWLPAEMYDTHFSAPEHLPILESGAAAPSLQPTYAIDF